MAVYAVALTLSAMVTGTAGMWCPGTHIPGGDTNHHSWVKAWIEVYASVYSTDCAVVAAEIQARAQGQSGWVDPHNGGTYGFESSTAELCNLDGYQPCTVVRTNRTANPTKSVGGQKYVDKQVISLKKGMDGGCVIEGCSESQGLSVVDFSTNYCDLLNLYCGKADGCTPISKDFNATENGVKKSFGAGHDFTQCVVKTPPAEAVPQHVELIAFDQLQKKSEDFIV